MRWAASRRSYGIQWQSSRLARRGDRSARSCSPAGAEDRASRCVARRSALFRRRAKPAAGPANAALEAMVAGHGAASGREFAREALEASMR